MNTVFLHILETGITASWLVLAVLALHLLLYRLPRRAIALLWLLVAVRLVCPIQIESTFSLVPSTQVLIQEDLQIPVQEAAVEQDYAPSAQRNALSPTAVAKPAAQPRRVDALSILSSVWLAGAVLMAVQAAIRTQQLRRKLSASLCIQPGVYRCEAIDSPFLFGLAKPKIYLPTDLDPEEIPLVLAHEEAHLHRRDHLHKFLGYLLLCIYWFHPVLWIGYAVFSRDMEIACDECVTSRMDRHGKAAYSRALLHYGTIRTPAAGPLTFGGREVRNRITRILHYRTPSVWITAVGMLTAVILSLCFLTTPAGSIVPTLEYASESQLQYLLVGHKTAPAADAHNANAITLMRIMPEQKTISVQVLYPYSLVRQPDCTDSNGSVHMAGKGPLGACYPLGLSWLGPQGGLEYLRQCVDANYDTAIDGCLGMDAAAFLSITEAVGGIEEELTQSEAEYLNAIDSIPGEFSAESTVLNGQALLAYFYMPDDTPAASVGRQEAVLEKLLANCQTLSTEQLQQLFQAVLPEIFTDLDDSGIQTIQDTVLPLLHSGKITLQKTVVPDGSNWLLSFNG